MRATLMSRLKRLGMTYREYLRSDHWADVKRRYRESDLPQNCMGCDAPNVQYHHRTYNRVGHELLTDILPLCRQCHQDVHQYEKRFGTNINATHKILRVLRGWTRAQTRDRFAPFQVEGNKYYCGTNPRARFPRELLYSATQTKGA
jgi:hypothetical protein